MKNLNNQEITNVEEVLSILNPTNEVLELRILGTKKGTVSGYFDDMKKLTKNANTFDGVHNVYITLNPCNKDLLSRCKNKVKNFSKETTKDNEIKKRVWLPIDFDPVRPSGISSSEEEHKNALQCAKEVREFLSKNGFGNGVLADSGNGAHLLYKLDLENNDENTTLIKKFLLSLDFKFSDEKVDVDKKVFNPARIWKLYGTTAVKGDSSLERPHRIAKILDLPSEISTVDIEKIKAVANMLPTIDKGKSTNGSDYKFDVQDFIEKHGIEVYKEKPYAGGTIWVIKCPMNDEHTDNSSYIIQYSNGAISASCHHNSCSEWKWKDLRMKFEPDCYDKESSLNIEPPPSHLAEYHEKLSSRGFGIDEKGFLYKMEFKSNTYVKTNLCNFIAIPIETITTDDNSIKTTFFKIKGYINTEELPVITVSSSDFYNMNWTKSWGLKANIFSSYGGKDKVRESIQLLHEYSNDVNEFHHLGWKNINNKWCYLHAKGAIGATNIKVNVQNDGLQSYSLQNPNDITSLELKNCIKESIKLLDLHKDTFILWGLCYLTPLCEPLRQVGYEPGFSVWVEGRSGSQKTTLSSLFLNHFGEKFSTTNLPASFKDTSNAMERKSSLCKDSLLLIDDFKPSTTKRERDEMIKKARDILWSYSNRTGRQRMKADTSLRTPYIPKGMAIFTGEDNLSIGGESTVARYLSMELKHKDIDLIKLGECQANSLLLNQAMTGYIAWLANKMVFIPNECKKLFEEFRDESINLIKAHNRFHGIIAWIKLGLTYGLQYALENGVLAEDQKSEIINHSIKRLIEILLKQAKSAEEETIPDKFINAMSELLSSGKIKLVSLFKDEYEEEEQINYSGQMLGWYDDEYYYFLPNMTYKQLIQFYSQQGISLGVTSNTLYKELSLAGISFHDKKNSRSTIVKKIDGKSKRVLKVYRNSLDQI